MELPAACLALAGFLRGLAMSDLNLLSADLHQFLARYGIESRNVAMILRANDEATRFALEAAIAWEISAMGGAAPGGRATINGVFIAVADLDHSRVP